MARYEVRLVRRGISVEIPTAEEAYEWLDNHAAKGEGFVINALGPDGVTTVDYGSWSPQTS